LFENPNPNLPLSLLQFCTVIGSTADEGEPVFERKRSEINLSISSTYSFFIFIGGSVSTGTFSVRADTQLARRYAGKYVRCKKEEEEIAIESLISYFTQK
jgi:hypothetical protein